jgi:hypothetical protein
MKNGNHMVVLIDIQEAVGPHLLIPGTAGGPVTGGVITLMEKNGFEVVGEEDS